MAGVNLERARRKVAAKILVDRCRVTWDPERYDDDVLDPETLALVPPAGDAPQVWEGACKVSPVGRVVTHRERAIPPEGPIPPPGVTYKGTLPWDAPEIPVGAVLEVTASRYDPQLIGGRFVVDSPERSSLLVSRKLWLREE